MSGAEAPLDENNRCGAGASGRGLKAGRFDLTLKRRRDGQDLLSQPEVQGRRPVREGRLPRRPAVGEPGVCYGEETVVLSPLAVTVKVPHGFDA